jgi:hypothetical protein
LKSPVATTCQLGPGLLETGAGDDAGSVEFPDGDLPAVVLPQDVGLAVTIEIAADHELTSLETRHQRHVVSISQTGAVKSTTNKGNFPLKD